MSNESSSLNQFLEEGYIDLGSVVDAQLCSRLLTEIRAAQTFSPDIFLDEKSFLEKPEYTGVNPMPGRNILERFEDLLKPLEATAEVTSLLQELLGDGYSILRKKVICGVPEKWIPGWVLARISENPVNNLGPYIKPEYRHITYFYGIDFHQDIIDLPGRDLDFITLYVYLHDVDGKAAPLNLLPGSHRFGVDKFPHQLTLVDQSACTWYYQNSHTGQSLDSNQLVVTGKTGNVALWHSCTIHGTQPNSGDEERISLRYLIVKDPDSNNTYLDRVNADISKLKFDNSMRLDLEKSGESRMKKNYLFDSYKSKSGSE